MLQLQNHLLEQINKPDMKWFLQNFDKVKFRLAVALKHSKYAAFTIK